ncbi:class II aldolase/adducin family protein [Mycobacterium lepromatosis]
MPPPSELVTAIVTENGVVDNYAADRLPDASSPTTLVWRQSLASRRVSMHGWMPGTTGKIVVCSGYIVLIAGSGLSKVESTAYDMVTVNIADSQIVSGT